MEVIVISQETIKPSSPTPKHLQSYSLSFLDQIASPVYVPIVLFYPITDATEKLSLLKESFARTLKKFPHLAGRIKDNQTIDCNDEGSIYLEAEVVDTNLPEFLKEPSIDLLKKLLPLNPTASLRQPINQLSLVAIQTTSFPCGGIAIAGCFHHRAMDAVSASIFLNSWAREARIGTGEDEILPDSKSGSSRFPPISGFTYSSILRADLPLQTNLVARRFVIDSSAVARLKSRARSDNAVNPSRFQTVCGFMWKHLLGANSRVNSGRRNSSILVLPVDVRSRVVPPISQFSVGNLVFLARACYNKEEEEGEGIGALVGKVREGVSEVNDEKLKRLQSEEEGQLVVHGYVETLLDRESKKYLCSSWCRIPVNEVDFGWGRPVWVGVYFDANVPSYMEQFLVKDGSSGDIEVLLVLSEKETAELENDEEFLQFAKLNPAIRIPADA